MSKLSRDTAKSNRKLTDFFARQGSMTSSALSSLPSSSQPRASQRETPPTTQIQSHSGKKKALTLRPGQEVLSLSSDSGPIVISSDTTHISISSNTSSSSLIVISDSSNPAGKLKQTTKSVSRPSKSSKPVKLATRAKPTSPSNAKTTVRRRSEAADKTGGPSSLSASKLARSRKRKWDWDACSSSEESKEKIFIPKPSLMNPSLTTAPVPQPPLRSPKNAVSRSSRSSPDLIIVPSSPLTSLLSLHTKSSKRARLEIREPPTNASGNEADVEELVPSSQSDEQELSLPKDTRKDPAVVKQTVDKWRREASVVISSTRGSVSLPPEEPPASPPATSPVDAAWASELPSPISAVQTDADGDINMIHPTSPADLSGAALMVDAPNTPPQVDSEGEVSRQLQLEYPVPPLYAHCASREPVLTAPCSLSGTSRSPLNKPITPDFRPLTPPPEDFLPKPRATPKRLTVQEKTALMIQKMKADALVAAARESSEEELGPLQELDSDSDDDSILLGWKGKAKTPSRNVKASSSKLPLRSSDASSSAEPMNASTRYVLRRRSSPKGLSPPGSPKHPDIATQTKAKGRKAANPLDMLLKEKKSADQRGTGSEGLRAAEAALLQSEQNAKAKGKMRAEIDDEDSADDARWADEEAAMRHVYRGTEGLSMITSSPTYETDDSGDSDDSDNEHEDFAVDAATKLLGADKNKTSAVSKILHSDRQGWLGKRKGKKVAQGVPLWETTSSASMDCEVSLSRLPSDNAQLADHPILNFLRIAVDSNDQARLSRCLIPQLFSSMDRSQLFALVPWLSSIVLSPCEPRLVQRATEVLTLTARKFAGTPLELSPLVVWALRTLGAKEESLALIGVQAMNTPCGTLPVLQRSEGLTRLVCFIKDFIENDAVSIEDIPNLSIALLLIGLDPSSPGKVKTEVTVAVDMLCARVPGSSDGTSDIEPLLCSRLLKLASGWALRNRAYMLSFLCGGSQQVFRLARWLAYCMISGSEVPLKSKYFSLPDLGPLFKLLSPSTGSGGTFDVLGNAEKDNYFEELMYNIGILDNIFNDVEAYTQEEKSVSTAPTDDLGSTSIEKPPGELQEILNLLNEIHGKISDTRAARLERTRLKTTMQNLTIRIHYQRLSYTHSGAARKPRTLQGYFARPVPVPKKATS